MDIKRIEEMCSSFVEELANHMAENDHVLTDMQFYKADNGKVHAEIKAKKRGEDDMVLWWVCALPLHIKDTCMEPSLEDFHD